MPWDEIHILKIKQQETLHWLPGASTGGESTVKDYIYVKIC
jgi:hypothetical protein